MSDEELRIDEYPFAVRRLSEDEGNGYLIEYPDVPGCMSDGETPEQAIVNGRDALRCALLAKMEFGSPIAEPGSRAKRAAEDVGLRDDLRAYFAERAARKHVPMTDLVNETLAKVVELTMGMEAA